LRLLFAGWGCALGVVIAAWGQATQPVVAVHDSELTRALESTPATGATPTGSGTTGYQWWPTDWHYFIMPESVKEALRSDGTAFTVVSDSNIAAGGLLTNGLPKYPIVISLACEAVRDDEVAQLTNYVAAGGFLLVGSSAFTRTTNGTTRGDFAFANALGVHMVRHGLTNWGANRTFTVQPGHRLIRDIPEGELTWRMPSSAEEISWGISPSHPFLAPHDVWQVEAGDATVIASGGAYPFLLVKPFGKGYFIYHAAFQPLIGHGGFGPGMYAYMIFRRAIEWAFESASLPVPKLSPWPYEYDAAFMVRHDIENFTNEIAAVEASAQVEHANGAKGDYYFCTGTVRVDVSASTRNSIITGLRRAVTNYGATIGPHNGGLKNPNNPSLVPGQYDYWHWGPDEALDATPAGYPSGKAYAFTSISNSFQDVEGWLSGTGNGSGLRSWVACYFNATREDSYDIQAALNVKITGDQKLTPFPHWTLSTRTANKRYPLLSQPVSDWYVGGLVAQSLEPWHPPGVHNSATMHSAVDFYYNLGALINIYSHTLSTGLGDAGQLVPDYIAYSLNTNLHPRIWSANATGVYEWWLQRSNAQTSISFATNGNQSVLTFSIANSTQTNLAIEALILGTNSFCDLSVLTNGVPAAGSSYRVNGQVIKLQVGTAVTNAVISYYALGPGTELLSEPFDSVPGPALPVGWSSSANGAQSAWVAQNATADTPPNSAFSPDPASVGLNELVSPLIALPVGQPQLIFRNSYDLEAGLGGEGYDGGVLEIKIGTNSFTDILTAGGSFVSGGYNTTIDSGWDNPLGGRRGWSGSSGGFITTLVNLPETAGGQTVQLRWRCGTDISNSKAGWWIDTVTVFNRMCSCCGGETTNTPPLLPIQTNRTMVALTSLTVTNTASDADLPAQVLSYQLIGPPEGAGIDDSGVITWTPTAAQAPSTNLITTVVTDNGSPAMSATNSFVVAVIPSNNAPEVPVQPDRTAAELTALIVTNTATDADEPGQTLTYELLSPPVGAAISTNGVITWVPSEAQGPGAFTLTTVVTDSGTPPLSATNGFTVTVGEVNIAPILPAQPGRTVSELTTLAVTNAANDADLPANMLVYALLAGPEGASVSTSGVITWTPSEAQGPSTNSFITVVTDNGAPPLSATNSFVVLVTEVNDAPVLPVQTNRTVLELTTLLVTNTATDADIPANTLSYSLVNPPAGAMIDAKGVIAWPPAATQPPSTNVVTTVVTDNGTPPLSATNSFTVFIATTNSAPVLPVQADRTLAELTPLVVTNTATDADVPANMLAYMLLAAPAGAAISTNGVITWTPSEPQGPGSYTLTTVVTDSGAPPLSATNSFAVTVDEVNSTPVLSPQTNRTVLELTTLAVTNTATDMDIPANTLSYSLVNPPAGVVIDTNGVITWTPTAAQGPSTNVMTTVVTDDGTPPLSTTNGFTVFVIETNNAPVLPVQADRTLTELTALVVTNTAIDADIPTNALAYTLLAAPAGATISASGVITWTPSEAQGPSTNLMTTVVTDDGTPPLSATNSFTVFVTDTNAAPVLPVQADRTLTELTALVVTNTATDIDLPANTLVYTLLAAPAGTTISTNGVITWMPSEAQGPGGYTLTTVVTDDGVPALSATNSFAVTVTEVNSTPVLLPQTNRTVLELTTLLLTNNASDADIPANTLTYSLVNPPTGAVIDTNGVIAWTPTEAQGPSTNVMMTVVTDNGVPPLSATNSFTLIVIDTNGPPGLLFADDFTRETDPGPLTPWVAQSGRWAVTGGTLRAGKNQSETFAHAYLTNSWTNYSVQAQFEFASGADGGGVGGFLNPTTGAHYAAWIYPENSPGGSRVLKLLKFQNWDTYGYNGSAFVPMEQASLPSVGTTWHTLTLSLSNSQITVSYDTNQLISATDTEDAPYTSGGVCVSIWTPGTKYFMWVDNVVVNSLADESGSDSNNVPPVMESIEMADGSLVISWSAVSGKTYRLQFTEGVENPTWTDVVPDVLATGPTVTITNALGGSQQRFYRALLVQ